MNQLTENKGRQDAKLKEKKELKMISTERVSFSAWARWMAFNSESVEVENTDFILFPTSPLFQLGKTYRNAAIMTYFKIGEEEHALKKGFRNLDFIRTGKDAGTEGNFPYVVTSEGHVGYEVIVNADYDEVQGPDIIGYEPMKDSCIDKIELHEGDFIIIEAIRFRPGDYCVLHENVIDYVQGLWRKYRGGRIINIHRCISLKKGALQSSTISFVVKKTKLMNGVQMIYTQDGRVGYNIVKNDSYFLF